MIEAAVSQAAEQAMSALNIPLLSFGGGKLEFLQQTTVALVILFAVVDTAAIVASDGGFRPKAFYYLALLLVISSVCFFAGPSLIAAIM